MMSPPMFPQAPAHYEPPRASRKKSGAGLIVALAIVALLLGAGAVVAYVMSTQGSSPSPAPKQSSAFRAEADQEDNRDRVMARMDMGMDRFAAQTGTADALFELGMLYATGLDVEADLVVAHKWFNLAALRGNRAALARRVELAREMSANQIALAQKLAREWLATH